MSSKLGEQDNLGVAHVMVETTAGEARAGALNATVAEQVEYNVSHAHDAAEDAANVAKVKGLELTGEPISTLEQLKAGASHATMSAAAEGEKDVESIKAAGASYIEQAKNLASSAIATARSYLPASLGGQPTSPDHDTHAKPASLEVQNVESSMQPAVSSAVETMKDYADTAKGTTGTHSTQLAEKSSLDVPPTDASLESGRHTVLEATYPSDADSGGEVE
ncbi:hypothetical protein AX15_001546 [Amanita polypyramis BW_CC]|nr:hypothetical protein AX15_001546 [Amanita polypyramis BW_CC]